MKFALALLAAAALSHAGPILYSFTAPAITTGPEQAAAYSFSFTEPALLTADTDITSVFSAPSPFDANFPVLTSVMFFEGPASSIAIEYTGPPGSGSEIGSLLGSVGFDTPGVYSVDWQIIGAQAGDATGGTLTITDEGAAGVPEPSSMALAALGLALAAGGRRGILARCLNRSHLNKSPRD